jgi:hypothetical protein
MSHQVSDVRIKLVSGNKSTNRNEIHEEMREVSSVFSCVWFLERCMIVPAACVGLKPGVLFGRKNINYYSILLKKVFRVHSLVVWFWCVYESRTTLPG